MRYVYLIQSLENGYYKIGISKHPHRRINQLKTGSSSQLKLIDTYLSENAFKIENALHSQYSHVRQLGEWFDLSIADEVNFRKKCRQIDESINILRKMENVFL